MAEQFITRNQAVFEVLQLIVAREYDGTDLYLSLKSASAIGAVPLVSPTTARPDYGLLVQPRFPWAGIGPMLGQMGWRIVPTPLRMPLLKRSERRVPIWVLSSMILLRLRALLESLDRRFEVISQNLQAPKGLVRWTEYATKQLPSARFLSVPCSFPDLREDRHLKGAIRFCLEAQLCALETQKEQGAFVHQLIELANQLLVLVRTVPIYLPSSTTLNAWLQRPMRVEKFTAGLEAVGWTVDERGLAGASDLQGIPWTMPMDCFFEAWVETIFAVVAKRTGGRVKTARNRETVHAISWDPSFTGSQKSLIPDLLIEWPDLTLIVDAKYKRHWEELQQLPWASLENELRDQHRNDLLQVLAYANLARTSSILACLVYPCSPENWNSLRGRQRLIHKAEILIGTRVLRLWLTAVPMASSLDQIAALITAELQTELATEI